VRCLGVDGWKKGWVAVVLDDGRFAGAHTAPDLATILEREPDAARCGVDMPIGLVAEGERHADNEARAFLGAKRSSIFPVPPRPVVEAPDWPTALELARDLWGKGISKQVFHLFGKILEVDALADDERIVEVHPEVAFALMTGAPLASKKTWGGQQARARALADAGIVVPEDLGEASVVPPDDVLDAAVTAWSACRVATGQARRFPTATEQRDGARVIAIYG
jgi:predicted RNase H-like nuclease